jgi:copper chaperone CopZ
MVLLHFMRAWGHGRAYDHFMRIPLVSALLTVLTLTGCSGSDVQKPTAANAAPKQTTQVAYTVTGMHCNSCAEAITAEVAAVKGVRSVQCTFESKCAVLEVNNPTAQAEAERAITKLGFTITPCAVPAAGATQPATGVSSK